MQYDDISREELEKEILDFFDSTSGKVDPNPGPQSCGINHRTSLVHHMMMNQELHLLSFSMKG